MNAGTSDKGMNMDRCAEYEKVLTFEAAVRSFSHLPNFGVRRGSLGPVCSYWWHDA